jgi:hypothetical protein
MIRPVLRLAALVLPAVLVAACGSPASPSSTTTTTTSTTTTTTSTTTVSNTETFTGTLGSGGSNYHIFHTLPGVFTVTLVSVSPDTVLPPLGMGFGMWDGTTCTPVLSTLSAVASTVMTGTASIETDVCIKMYDPTPWDPAFTLSYTLTAVHFAKSS